jgi:hypothetical protein
MAVWKCSREEPKMATWIHGKAHKKGDNKRGETAPAPTETSGAVLIALMRRAHVEKPQFVAAN